MLRRSDRLPRDAGGDGGRGRPFFIARGGRSVDSSTLLADKLSIAQPPFDTSSGDPEQETLADDPVVDLHVRARRFLRAEARPHWR